MPLCNYFSLNYDPDQIDKAVDELLPIINRLYYDSFLHGHDYVLNGFKIRGWILDLQLAINSWIYLSIYEKNTKYNEEKYKVLNDRLLFMKTKYAIFSIRSPVKNIIAFSYLNTKHFPKEWYGYKLICEHRRRSSIKIQRKYREYRKNKIQKK